MWLVSLWTDFWEFWHLWWNFFWHLLSWYTVPLPATTHFCHEFIIYSLLAPASDLHALFSNVSVQVARCENCVSDQLFPLENVWLNSESHVLAFSFPFLVGTIERRSADSWWIFITFRSRYGVNAGVVSSGSRAEEIEGQLGFSDGKFGQAALHWNAASERENSGKICAWHGSKLINE